MHYFIFTDKDTYITENSADAVVQFPNSVSKNYGKDEILELKKEFLDSHASSPFNVSRILTQFDYSDLSSSIHLGFTPRPDSTNPLSSSFYLRYYEVEGQGELDKTYSLSTHMIRQTWDEGTGKHFDNPNTKLGCTWESGSSIWSSTESGMTSGSRPRSGGGVWLTTAGTEASQSFSNQSGDIEINVTDLVEKHLDGTYGNFGFITKFSGSYESDSTPVDLKFFSRNTNTIYQPRLEVRWNDINYPDSITGSINYITMSGEIENHIFIKGLQPKYRESEEVRFRVGCRKKYTTKTFTESMLTSSFYIPKGSGSYSIVDVATDTAVVPFSSYTSMSADTNSMYFDQRLNTFEPGRYYKVLFKLKYTDGQEVIIDNDEEFKVI